MMGKEVTLKQIAEYFRKGIKNDKDVLKGLIEERKNKMAIDMVLNLSIDEYNKVKDSIEVRR